ncbi:CvpA family protein [Actinobacillus delphinicola]|uniref:Colicin V production protein n=1 Tax=Actinobacillus delphinicola TaxID=51161 RepID=A0A448TRU9_9PAST|nr:CvpA family protein [Actinobacillus delphinicola]VEJ08615.1 colicin V production protein [Actinobacillus delphinicola]
MNNYIDWAIIAIIGLSIVVSLWRGFIREVVSLATWIAAFIITVQFYPYLATHFTNIANNYVRNGTAMVALFIGTLIVGGIINFLLGQLVDKTGLSGTDRVLGACFGFLRGILIVSALLFFTDSFTQVHNTEMWKSSQLIPHFHFIVDWFFQQMQANSSLLSHIQSDM